MKLHLFTLLSILSCCSLHSQHFEWVKQISDYAIGQSCAYSNGDVYVSGYFFNQLKIDSAFYYSQSADDGFIAKFSTSGVLKWVRTVGGPGSQNCYKMVTDKEGNLYVTGDMGGLTHFTSTGGQSTTVQRHGSMDFFVAKYNTEGDLQWATSCGTAYTEHCYGITVDSDFNVYIAGIQVKTTYTAFLSKVSNSGEHLWTEHYGASSWAYNVKYNGEGLFFVGTGSGDFGNGHNLSYNGPGDVFVAYLDLEGNTQWVNRADTQDGIIYPWGLNIDKSGNCVIAAEFTNKATLSNHDTLIANKCEILLVKYNKQGVILDYCQKGVPGYVYHAYDVQLNGEDEVYLASAYLNVNDHSDHGGYYCKFDKDLNLIWDVKSFGSGEVPGCCVDDENNMYSTGYVGHVKSEFGNTTLYKDNGAGFVTKIFSPSVGIKESSSLHNTTVIYPNPSAGKFILKGNLNGAYVKVFDANYKLVIAGREIHSEEFEIDLSSKAKGVYLIQISKGKTIETRKVVIQ